MTNFCVFFISFKTWRPCGKVWEMNVVSVRKKFLRKLSSLNAEFCVQKKLFIVISLTFFCVHLILS